MRAPGVEPGWAGDTTVPLTIQPQVGSRLAPVLSRGAKQAFAGKQGMLYVPLRLP